ncbi:hypothetical protein [Yoonia vestfoldensis]|uniref:Uncharacterized protein n=1 Tax=Yoonia vestfoldensis TaxID=245188 RepID=A0A1Y0EB89_9RHOB|nr:hypothetical protein [Yoonia vestfoldensis]ARU00823.1 hypothetical protein LOKVESSMR4R_01507 [Yoonia vestfoldensis]
MMNGADAACLQGIDILVVGDLDQWQASGRLRGIPAGCAYLGIAQLTPFTLRRYAPALVLSPLVCDGFDAVDVAQRLQAARYQGLYRVIADDLPDAQIIRNDIRNAAPDLNFDLLVLPPASP